MPELTMGIIETRFAEMIWEREPISTVELTKLSEKELGWKRPTMYTVLRRLCEKGIFKNENGVVTSLISREEFKASQSQQLIDGSFGGSLPAFLAAFTKRRALSENEIKEIRELIDSCGKEDKS
ncbi:MAG: BlaI/MecI/CopY family transcriptional regulator [Oscillospiraceae bacterium]|nr:BlaI/MecI/CopY family transcriptional regulator [Oscillospiraceae bacterium]